MGYSRLYLGYLMKTKLNTDYSGEVIQGFTSGHNVASVSSGAHVEMFNYSSIMFDTTVTIYFNQDNTTTYVDWPANKALHITNKINYITTDANCKMLFMWKNKQLNFEDIDTSSFLVDDEGNYLVDAEGRYLTSA